MSDLTTPGATALELSELESITGGLIAPSWWWIVQFGLSEANDFVRGLGDGYAAA